MSKIALLNINGEKVSDINLQDNVWNIEPNDAVLHNAIILSQASLRQGTHSTKTRAEVSGGGKKPWKQKGTGNARAGSNRSPIWRKGGISFGPKPREYGKKMNRKERRLALKSALSYKVIDKELVAIDNLILTDNKTKTMNNVLDALHMVDKKVLIVVNELTENLYYATRNLSQIKLIDATDINVLDLVTSDILLIEGEAIKTVEEVFN